MHMVKNDVKVLLTLLGKCSVQTERNFYLNNYLANCCRRYVCIQLPLRRKWQSCNTVHQSEEKKIWLVVSIRIQCMLIKIAEESLLSTKDNVCMGNLKGQIKHDRTFIYDSGQKRECKFNF